MRAQGQVFTQSEQPCGRLVYDYDSAERLITGIIPSISRPERVYGLSVDCMSAECSCGCEAFSDFREASLMPYRKPAAGVYAEQLAPIKGKRLGPLITRPDRSLCPHLRALKRAIRRRGLMPAFEQIEKSLIQRLDGMKDVQRKSA